MHAPLTHRALTAKILGRKFDSCDLICGCVLYAQLTIVLPLIVVHTTPGNSTPLSSRSLLLLEVPMVGFRGVMKLFRWRCIVNLSNRPLSVLKRALPWKEYRGLKCFIGNIIHYWAQQITSMKHHPILGSVSNFRVGWSIALQLQTSCASILSIKGLCACRTFVEHRLHTRKRN